MHALIQGLAEVQKVWDIEKKVCATKDYCMIVIVHAAQDLVSQSWGQQGDSAPQAEAAFREQTLSLAALPPSSTQHSDYRDFKISACIIQMMTHVTMKKIQHRFRWGSSILSKPRNVLLELFVREIYIIYVTHTCALYCTLWLPFLLRSPALQLILLSCRRPSL